MKLKEFLDMYDNWNGRTRLNDDNLDMLAEDHTLKIAEEYKQYHDYTVVAFGFYDDTLCIRIKP